MRPLHRQLKTPPAAGSRRVALILLVLGGLGLGVAASLTLLLVWTGTLRAPDDGKLQLSLLCAGAVLGSGFVAFRALRGLRQPGLPAAPMASDLRRQLRRTRRPSRVCMRCLRINRVEVAACAGCGSAESLFTVSGEEDVRVLMLALGD